MNSTKLRPMSKPEFEIFLQSFREQIIRDAMTAAGVNLKDATRILEADLEEIIPNGFESENNFWFTIRDAELKTVGTIWYFVRGSGDKRIAYLNDICIHKEHRRKGYAKKALSLIEDDVRSRGIRDNMAVHILGDFNDSAIKLFKSLGYFVTDIKMEKTIS